MQPQQTSLVLASTRAYSLPATQTPYPSPPESVTLDPPYWTSRYTTNQLRNSHAERKHALPSPSPSESRPQSPFDLSQRPLNHKQSEDDLDIEKQKLKEESTHTPALPIHQRIKHFTWAWFTLTMSTGGIATLLSTQPHAFPGLFGIGLFFYIFNITIFVIVTATLLWRFMAWPGEFMGSLKHERESLFFPTFWLSLATIITGTHKYVVKPADGEIAEWFLETIFVVFWVYIGATFVLAVCQYSFLFAVPKQQLAKMMPSWLLPAFPVMLAGTIASVIAIDQPENKRLSIILGGLAAQGLGFFISLFMYAHLIGRLIVHGLPNREHRTALYIGCGPPSFTILALLGMANALPAEIEINGDVMVARSVLQAMALMVSIFLWLLALWFFCIATVAVALSPPQYFHLGWWAMVFPNTGFTLATISIGNALNNEAIRYIGNVMSVMLILTWAFCLYAHARAVWVSDIMHPGKDEDVADH